MKQETTVAVLIPSTGRAEQMRRNVAPLLAQKRLDGVTLVVVLAIPDDDWASLMAASRLLPGSGNLFIYPRAAATTAVEGWNIAYGAVGADWYVLGADDIAWRDGWLEEALAVAEKTGARVIGLNDGHTNLDQYAPHYMATRDFCETELDGHIAPPDYRSWWFDREVCERAQALGAYAPAWQAHAEHLHPDWRTAEMDDTYRQAWPLHDADRLLYQQRREAGYRRIVV